MTGSSERWPLGVDLGSETTAGCAVDGADFHSLAPVSTRIALTGSGFAVGDTAVETGADPVVPLPYLDETERPMSGVAAEYPLVLFFELLRERWETTGVDEATETRPTEPNGEGPDKDGANDGERTDTSDRTGLPASTPDQTEEGLFAGEDSDSGPSDDQPATTETTGSAEVSDPRADDATRSISFNPTTIAVPGGYSAADIDWIESAATAAGFGGVRAVRRPAAVAATELPDLEDDLTIAVADIDGASSAFAIVTLCPPGEIVIEATTTLREGRATLDEALARWLLDELESEHDISIRCDDATFDRVRTAAHDALGAIDRSGETTATVDLDLDDGIEVIDGGVLGTDALSIDRELDVQTAIRALNEPLYRLQTRIEALREAVDTDEIDSLVCSGGGSRLSPVVIAVENAFDRPSRSPTLGDRETAAAIGAAVLSTRRASGSDPIDREPLGSDVVLRALGETGVEERVVTTPTTAPGDESAARLVPASDEQLSGVFEIARKHRITDRLDRLGVYDCSGFPPETTRPEIDVTVAFEAEPTDGDAITVSVAATGTDGEDEIGAIPTDEAHSPWLAHADADHDRIQTSEPTPTAFEHRTDAAKALDSVDDEGVARAAWKIRNKIYDRAIRRDEDLDAEELELLLREFDKNLRIEGVEIIDPEIGSEFDSTRHRITRAEEADEPEGTVLEVLSLGVAVDGTVVETAAVVAAK
jgi:molecular chaperone DnaK (HSP70)